MRRRTFPIGLAIASAIAPAVALAVAVTIGLPAPVDGQAAGPERQDRDGPIPTAPPAGQSATAGFDEPTGTVRPSGQSVTPVFDGWYRNEDGTFSLSFGYFSRNSEEALDILLGPDNFIEPARFDGPQPTHFLPQPQDRGPGRGIRHWGVFTVTVPADFGVQSVVWTLRSAGEVHAVPGHLRVPGYEIDALGMDASGHVPPKLKLDPAGPVGMGPAGISAGPLTATVDVPLELVAWAVEAAAPPVTLRWFKHRGPGQIVFRERELRMTRALGEAGTTATFSEPGEYVLRVRATDEATELDRFCCWTNGYLNVTVSPRDGEPAAPPGREASTRQLDDPATFTRDVAPILQASCQTCHRPGSIGPMSLVTYDEVRPWAPLIRERVRTRMMPPWHIDPTVGIRDFANDPSLTDEEIATIVAWVDAGAPKGDPADLPAPGSWPDGVDWRLSGELGPPDLVVKSDPYTVRADGQDQWWTATVDAGLEEDRWIRAIEVRPSSPAGRRATHHVMIYAHLPEGRTELLTEWAMGKVGEVMPPGTGRLLPAGATIGWDVHYVPIGEPIPDDRAELGLWLHPEGYEPPYENRLQLFRADPTDGPRGATLDIPPGEVRVTQGTHVLASAARIESFQPHMHLRGAAMSMEAITPDGRREILSRVDRFQHGWQISYRFADHVMPLLPRGTVLVFTAWHDNRSANPSNPDPSQWVGFGRRTVDEMAHAWVGITDLTDEQLERLASERGGR